MKVDLFSPLAGQIHPITCHQLKRSDRGGYPEPIGLDHFVSRCASLSCDSASFWARFFAQLRGMHLLHVILYLSGRIIDTIVCNVSSSHDSSPPLGLGTGFGGFSLLFISHLWNF